jgi:hypothetical protein
MFLVKILDSELVICKVQKQILRPPVARQHFHRHFSPELVKSQILRKFCEPNCTPLNSESTLNGQPGWTEKHFFQTDCKPTVR